MSLWNRFATALMQRPGLARDSAAELDDAIVVGRQEHDRPRIGKKGPQIPERYFGFGMQRPAAERPQARMRAKSLWARLGIGRGGKTAEEDGFGPTAIRQPAYKPKPKPAPEQPKAAAPAKSLPTKPETDRDKPVAREHGFIPAPARQPAPIPAPEPKRTPARPKRATPPLASRGDEEILHSLFGEQEPVREKPQPVGAAAGTARPAPQKKAAPAKKRTLDRGDLTIAALGITLGFTCAVFPWYIFFNQEKFGVREFVFEGGRGMTPTTSLSYQPVPVGKPFSTGEVPQMGLDFFPTATLPAAEEQARAAPSAEQPFPLDLVNFRLVHVANGRAMIEDADGLWVVQPGSRLPDASRVAAIEQRKGGWVLVTSQDKVVELRP